MDEGQGSDPNSQGQGEQDQEGRGGNEVSPGIQKRFDEMTARFHQADRERAEAHAQNKQLMDRILQLQQGTQAQPQEVPEIDPDDMKKLEYVIGRALEPLKRRNEELAQLLQQTQVGSATAAVEAQLAKLNNPQVADRTKQLIAGWSQAGVLGRVATPEDALKMALGEAMLNGLGGNAQVAQVQNQFNSMPGAIMQGVAGGNQQVRRPNNAVDPETLPLNERVAYYDKLLDGQEL